MRQFIGWFARRHAADGVHRSAERMTTAETERDKARMAVADAR